jgi:hypothetical protein
MYSQGAPQGPKPKTASTPATRAKNATQRNIVVNGAALSVTLSVAQCNAGVTLNATQRNIEGGKNATPNAAQCNPRCCAERNIENPDVAFNATSRILMLRSTQHNATLDATQRNIQSKTTQRNATPEMP